MTDRNIALENARMAFPLYPQMEVVQTGPGKDDWKVCTFNGEIEYGDELTPTSAYRNAQGERSWAAPFGVGGGTPPFTRGTTWCLDVVAALKDPNRNVPAKNHWTLARHRPGGSAVLLPDRKPHRDRRGRPDGVAQVVHDFGAGATASRPGRSK